MRVLLLLFQSGFLLFLFSSLIALAKTSKTMLNSSGESEHSCPVPHFRGNDFNFLPLRIMFGAGLSYMAFIMLRYVPSIPTCWRAFIINGFWILLKAFSASIEIIIWGYFLQFINVVYDIDWFVNIEESLHPWDKAHLVMMYDLFNMLLDSVC